MAHHRGMSDSSRQSRRVILVVTDTARGGAPSRLATLARGLRERGWVVLFVSLMPEGAIATELRSEGFAVDSMEMRTWRDAPAALLRLRRLISEFRPLVVQSALWHANLLARLAAIGTGVPVVNGHESVDEDKPRLRTIIDVLTGGLVAAHTAVAEAVAERVSTRDRVPRRKIEVIPIAKDWGQWRPKGRREDTRRRLGIPSDADVVAWSGRLHPVKNVGLLLSGLQQLPEWWLLIIGDGPERDILEDQAKDLKVDHRVKFAGEVSDVPRYLEAADVYCMVSLWEGLPAALMEAMAMGLPVVAPRVGAIPDLIDDGESGILLKKLDIPEIANAVSTANSSPKLGTAAQTVIRHRFREQTMVGSHESLWLRVSTRA